MPQTRDIHISGLVPLDPPRVVLEELPASDRALETVVRGREAIADVLRGNDDRLLIVVGPCSIHDEKAALEYAHRLAALSRELADRLLIVMRVYFEKPRTTIGWKGLINDPHLNGTFDIATGLRRARKLLLDINELGLPCGTEMLDPISPQYTAELVSWASIGARTTESQTHRQMASGLSMPVGFKNGTDGNIQTAIDAMEAARNPHCFLGIDLDGMTCVVHTTGNDLGHLILRGGRTGPNYDEEHVAAAVEMLITAGLPADVMVDCSHANSSKDHRKQENVFRYEIDQILRGNRSVIGLMLESNLFEGNQKIPADLSQLKYGVSVTDACIGWEKTEELLRFAHDALSHHSMAHA
jgi:3-deoxy-7-phosphoheptulonate synthase